VCAVPAAPAGIRRAEVGPGGQEEGAHAVGERGGGRSCCLSSEAVEVRIVLTSVGVCVITGASHLGGRSCRRNCTCRWPQKEPRRSMRWWRGCASGGSSCRQPRYGHLPFAPGHHQQWSCDHLGARRSLRREHHRQPHGVLPHSKRRNLRQHEPCLHRPVELRPVVLGPRNELPCRLR
jgi:hypothetical protein